MPLLKRPDGAEIHWAERGVAEGPLVLLAVQFFGYPEVFEGLLSDLATDHRVVTYDLRGTGSSSRQGPYDLATDAGDLEAVVEAVGGARVLIGTGDGVQRAVKVAAKRPDLAGAVLSPGGSPVGRRAATGGSDALAGSESVLEALIGMMATDYRSALRTIVAGANPAMDEDAARERVKRVVAYCPQEAAAPRLREWIAYEPLEEARALGDRLWVLDVGSTDWFPSDMAARVRVLLPDAHVEALEDGAISRPDLTAAIVRRITFPSPSHVESTGVGEEPRQQTRSQG
jgi:pimeloyl-ACP methyl ester carboxylesterase